MGSSNENSGLRAGPQSARSNPRSRWLSAEARPQPSPLALPWPPWDPTPAAPFASPPRFAASWAHADVRTRLALRPDRICFLARSHRPARPKPCSDAALLLSESPDAIRWTPLPPTCPCLTIEAEIGKPVKGLKIGVPKEYFAEGLDPEVRAAVEAGDSELAAAGCESCQSRCRTPLTRSQPITSSPRPKPRPTWRAMTACATAIAPRASKTLSEMYRRTP